MPIWSLSKLAVKEIFRKKDFYVALILIAAALIYASGIQFYDVQRVARYLTEIGLTLILFVSTFLTVSLAARQYPSEIQNRTCEVLMAKPIRRIEFILGKFFGSFLAGASALIIFYGVFIFIIRTKTDFFSVETAGETLYLFLLNLLVVSAMTSGFSYHLTPGANVTVSMLTYLLIDTYGPGLKGGFYQFLPHFEFFDLRQRFIHDWPPISLKLVGFLTLYAVICSTIFLMAGWFKFRKQCL